MATKQTYRITKRGATLRRKEEGKWVVYSADENNQIQLTQAQYESGAYSHLGLQSLTSTSVVDDAGDGFQESLGGQENLRPNPPVTDTVNDGSRTPDGNQERTVITDDDGNGGGGSTDENTDEVDRLIEAVENSKVGDGSFEKARQQVIAADLFEEDTLPDTKSGVLDALKSLKE